MFPIIDDIVLQLTETEETDSFKSWPLSMVQCAHMRRGKKGFKGFFSGLIIAVGCMLIILCDIKPNIDEITKIVTCALIFPALTRASIKARISSGIEMFRVAIGLPPLGCAIIYDIASMAKIANTRKQLALYNHL